MAEGSHEIIRDFTKARKFPNLIGRTPDGKRLIGGPYTITQFVGGGAVAGGLYLFRGLWMQFDTLTNVVLFFVPVIGTVFLLGKLRLAGRSPVSMLSGVLTAVTAPKHAPVNGRPVRAGMMPTLVHAGGYIHLRQLPQDPPAVAMAPVVTKAPVRTAEQVVLPARFAALAAQKTKSAPPMQTVAAAQMAAPAPAPAAPAPGAAPPRSRPPAPPRNGQASTAGKPASPLGVKGLLAVADKKNGRAER